MNQNDQSTDAPWLIRLAENHDIPKISTLIRLSSFELLKGFYTKSQISAALGPVFGVDEELISDGTYYVVELPEGGRIIGCGGWSFRESLFGSSLDREESSPRIDPDTGFARIRAFFIDPDYIRNGIATNVLTKCEDALQDMGFTRALISATLAGEKFYQSSGYQSVRRYAIDLNEAPSIEVVEMTRIF